MQTNTKIVIFSGIGLFIMAVIVFILLPLRASQSPPMDNLEVCKTLEYNGEGKINIMYFAEESEAREYTDFFLSTNPFSEHREDFNFYYIDDYEPECGTYNGIAVFCYSKTIISKASSCPNDYIVALDDQKSSIRSSAFQNVMSLNSRHSYSVFIHEFGHVFANLAEEYINNQRPQRGSENCVTSCEDFGENKDGCFDGCSDTSYLRSIDEGVMRTLSTSDYGLFNSLFIESLIEKRVAAKSPITGNQISEQALCEEQKYNLIEYNVNEGVKDITEETGCASGSYPALDGQYSYEITQDGEIIESSGLNMKINTDVQEGESLTGEVYDGETVFITTTTGGDTLNIKDEEGNIKYSQDVREVGATPCRI